MAYTPCRAPCVARQAVHRRGQRAGGGRGHGHGVDGGPVHRVGEREVRDVVREDRAGAGRLRLLLPAAHRRHRQSAGDDLDGRLHRRAGGAAHRLRVEGRAGRGVAGDGDGVRAATGAGPGGGDATGEAAGVPRPQRRLAGGVRDGRHGDGDREIDGGRARGAARVRRGAAAEVRRALER